MEEESKFLRVIGVIGIISSLYCSLYTLQDSFNLFRKHQPNTSQVQEGYVIPNKLEIQVKDLDGNGQDETMMKYDGKSYLLKVNEQGSPIIKSYKINPTEVIEE